MLLEDADLPGHKKMGEWSVCQESRKTRIQFNHTLTNSVGRIPPLKRVKTGGKSSGPVHGYGGRHGEYPSGSVLEFRGKGHQNAVEKIDFK